MSIVYMIYTKPIYFQRKYEFEKKHDDFLLQILYFLYDKKKK